MRFSSVFALMIVTAASPSVVQAEIVPPGDPVAGLSQSELSARWFRWAFSHPDGANPVQDTTGALAYLGNQGSYFFLAGSFGSNPVTRTATVYSNQYLFMPLGNALSLIPFFGDTEAEIRQDASDSIGVVGNLSLTLDGVDSPLPPPTTSLLDYRQTTPSGTFNVLIPAGAVFGIPEGTYQGVGDGYWVALQPMAPGAYQLHMTFHSMGTGPYDGVALDQDVTYNLTVKAVPEPAGLVLASLAALTLCARRMSRSGC